jgi:hypothetical protein
MSYTHRQIVPAGLRFRGQVTHLQTMPAGLKVLTGQVALTPSHTASSWQGPVVLLVTQGKKHVCIAVSGSPL